jgi:hypothetical protein
MGTRDIETAVFFDDDRRYADLLNGYIFDGKQVVTEKQFYSQDTREVGKSRRGSLTVKKKKNIQRFRDGVKRVAFGTSFTIIALIRFIGECRYVLWWKMRYLMTAR